MPNTHEVRREGESELKGKMNLSVGRVVDVGRIEGHRPGMSGKEVLADALAAMKAEGINGSVYCHPVGDHGHGSGPLIGLWDRQQGVPGRGDVVILPNTWFSIELSATTPVAEWDGKELWMGQEEDMSLDAAGLAAWVVPRQTEFHLVRP